MRLDRTHIPRAILAALVTCAAGEALAADVPDALTHQGRLYDKDGRPISGLVKMSFSLYESDADDAAPLATDALEVEVQDGYYSARLGEHGSFADFLDGPPRFLGITIGGDAEMTPRFSIGSVPYARTAGNAIGDITPSSVSIGGKLVIDEKGRWVGDPTGLQGPKGALGPMGPAGPQGLKGEPGADGAQGPAGLQGAMGPQGPMGPAGADGAKGDTGPMGPQGPMGPTGLIDIQPISGYAGASFANTGEYQFVGPNVAITIVPGQKIVASAAAALGTSSGTATGHAGICYQAIGEGEVVNFAGLGYMTVEIDSTRGAVAAAATISNLAGGYYLVGFCFDNTSATLVDDNDWVNGWVMVTH